MKLRGWAMLLCSVLAACTKAVPAKEVRMPGQRALEARVARLELGDRASGEEEPLGPLCADGEVEVSGQCFTACRDDNDCVDPSRCVIGDVPRLASAAPILASDEQDRILEAEALVFAARSEPIFDEQPLCEGACAPYTGDLALQPAIVLTYCTNAD